MMNYINLFQSIKSANTEIQAMGGIQKQNPVSWEKASFDVLITDKELNSKVRKLFFDGHHARAVEEAYKYLDNTVLHFSQLKNMSGSALMKKVFSSGHPILKINAGISASEQDEQLGYMEIFSGVMTGIRNPRAHDSDWEDTEERALQLLIFANHLIGKVKNATKQKEN